MDTNDSQSFVTRGELREVRSDVRALSGEVAAIRAAHHEHGRKLSEQDEKLNLILTKLDLFKSIKHWVGWVLVVSTSSAVVTIVSHVSGHIK